jgi:putative flavoprotein involved in K+ transport
MDIFWWLERTGFLARTIDEVAHPTAARREPSQQLIGRRPRNDSTADSSTADSGTADSGGVDLVELEARGVRLTGRFDGLRGARVRFRPDLAETAAAAQRQMHRVLDAVDRYAAAAGVALATGTRGRPLPLRTSATVLDLAGEGIGTVLVATGYRQYHPWLRLPITDPTGAIRQHRGVTRAPGVYVVGQRFQYRRDSGFIDGARHDARAVVQRMTTGRRCEPNGDRDEEPAA